MTGNSNTAIVTRLFSNNLFYHIVKHPTNSTYGTIIQRFVDNPESKNNGELLSTIYKMMSSCYRNEYFYQNTLLNKLLLGKHSVMTTTALTQIPVGKSKADFILINGKAVVYEIKTELDNFERLPNQVQDYYTAFDHVCVVTSEKQFAHAEELLKNTNVGIYVLTNSGHISARKEPIRDTSRLNHKAIFKLLRKKEYENILLKYYNELPSVSQVAYYGECLKMFSDIPLCDVYESVLRQLKSRNRIKINNFNEVPYELKSLIYFSCPTQYEWDVVKSFLTDNYQGGCQNVLSICQR